MFPNSSLVQDLPDLGSTDFTLVNESLSELSAGPETYEERKIYIYIQTNKVEIKVKEKGEEMSSSILDEQKIDDEKRRGRGAREEPSGDFLLSIGPPCYGLIRTNGSLLIGLYIYININRREMAAKK